MEETEKPTGTLGIERWVQFGFIGGALLSFWFLDHLFGRVVEFVARKANMASPNPTIVTAVAAIVSILLAAGLYRHKRAGKFAREVANELAQVTWPTRKETYSQTVVVVIVSIIAAIILGLFDFLWSNVTGTIY